MPDPLLYLKATAIAAVVSAACVFALSRLGRSKKKTMSSSASVLGIGSGIALAFLVLQLNLSWPPVNGLDRLLTIVVPGALAVELLTGLPNIPNWFGQCLRLGICVCLPPVLVHNSIYVTAFTDEWTIWQAIGLTIGCSLLLAIVWGLLLCLNHRAPSVGIPLSLSLSMASAGIAIMLAGYLQGGASAFPMSAALVGVAFGNWLGKQQGNSVPQIGFGVVGLFGVLFVGRFFGRISTTDALIFVTAPLLCWTAEIPFIRSQKPAVRETFRIVVVASLLLVVLAMAKHAFDRDMAPLL